MNTNDAAAAAPATRKPTKDDPTLWRVDDALWADLAPLVVIDTPRKKPGRPRQDDRPIVDAPIWIARSGGQWAALPRAFGAKSTSHDRFQEWVAHGCFARAWALLPRRYDGEVGRDWPWHAADGCLVNAPLGNKGALGRRRRPGRTRPAAASAGPSASS